MKLVIPVSHVDHKLALKLARRLAKMKSLADREVFVAATKADAKKAAPVLKSLNASARSVQYLELKDAPANEAYYTAANHMFFQSAVALHQRKNRAAWFWFEADCFPITYDFIDTLEEEYNLGRRPYMGVINASRYPTPAGGQIIRGEHMVGAGIYPPDFLQRCLSIQSVPERMPWDVWIEGHVVPQCYPTPVMYHAWNTGKYKIYPAGVLQGEDLEDRTGKHKYGGLPVPREVVVIHGSKDESLYSVDFTEWTH